jgi:hypothetical protein
MWEKITEFLWFQFVAKPNQVKRLKTRLAQYKRKLDDCRYRMSVSCGMCKLLIHEVDSCVRMHHGCDRCIIRDITSENPVSYAPCDTGHSARMVAHYRSTPLSPDEKLWIREWTNEMVRRARRYAPLWCLLFQIRKI